MGNLTSSLNVIISAHGSNDDNIIDNFLAMFQRRGPIHYWLSHSTTSSAGRMMMQIVGSFAEFERAMLRERTCNGLMTARKEGRIGGRRHKLKENQQLEIIQLVKSGKETAADAARLFNIHPSTVSRLLQHEMHFNNK